MSRGIPVVILGLCLSAQGAPTFQILSETYHVDGGIGYGLATDPSYDITSNAPAFAELNVNVSQRTTGGFPVYSLDDDGPDVMHIESLASRDDGGLLFYAGQESLCFLEYPPNYARASLIVDFMGEESFLNLDASRTVEHRLISGRLSWADAALTDLTDGSSWVIFEPTSPLPLEEAPILATALSVPIDPTHVYRLEANAYPVDCRHGSNVTVAFEFAATSQACPVIPAPGSIALAVLGAGLVGRWKRRS